MHFSFCKQVFFTVIITVVLLCGLEERRSAVSAVCHPNQSTALLQFKRVLDLRPGRLVSWQTGSDCCRWEGVACDRNTTSIVTEIRLSNITSQLGNVNKFDEMNSSMDPALFQLRYLQILDLSFNDFDGQIPKGISKLTHLTHLDLSNCMFSGEIPWEISDMTQLVSLNVSGNDLLQLQPPNFERLVRGLSNLRHLGLDCVNISMSGKAVSLLLSSQLPRLQTLSLSSSNILGPMDESLSVLSSLSYLDLSWNYLTHTSEFLLNFTDLRVLKLTNCSLEGRFPSGIFLLPQLEEVDLSINRRLVVDLPLDFQVKNSKISSLDLSLTKQVSNNLLAISRFTKLTELRMESSGLTGSFPSSWKSTGISVMDLSNNNIFGPVPEYFTSFFDLTYLDLGYNLLNGSIPSTLLNLSNLSLIDLSNNRISGSLPNVSKPIMNLEYFLIGDNFLSGDITSFVGKLPNLQSLDLLRNSLSGTLNMTLFSGMKNLFSLDLSYNAGITIETFNTSEINNNHISVPPLLQLYLSNCGIKTFPSFLYQLRQLRALDLADNQIRGRVPSWLWGRSLEGFTISNNQIEGIDWPRNDSKLVDSSLQYLNVSDNRIVGQIPTFICNFTALYIVDASTNVMDGDIPDCFTPSEMGNPFVINMNTNSLSGKIPKSLSNCSGLQVLDLGNNQLKDTFPMWLGSLRKLRILTLRSNLLWGFIDTQISQHGFPSLQILDISGNQFSGTLPAQLFKSFNSMKVFDSTDEPNFVQSDVSMFIGIMYAAATQRIKGNEIVIRKVLKTMTIIDLSNNSFSGNIPEEIGELKGLLSLNISRNNLSGSIPESFGDLLKMESLDLSFNRLSGIIPEKLSRLTFLAKLNLSFNGLQGRIPQGNQFLTFDESSFLGNPKLCGIQVVKKRCLVDEDGDGTHKQGDQENNQENDWQLIAGSVGFAVGLGMLILPVAFIKRVGKFYWNQIDRMACEERSQHSNSIIASLPPDTTTTTVSI